MTTVRASRLLWMSETIAIMRRTDVKWKMANGKCKVVSMSAKTFGITLLGCGTVGGGVANIVMTQRELLKQRTGIDLVLRHVVVKSREEYPPNHAELPMSLDAN